MALNVTRRMLAPFLVLLFAQASDGSCSNHTITHNHTCSASDIAGSTTPPCACPQPTAYGPRLCPRLEGIQIPCTQRLAISQCSFTVTVCIPDPTPAPTPAPTCSRPKYCESTSNVCVKYEEKTCSRTITERGGCIVYSEAGVCQQYTTITRNETYACTGSCLEMKPQTTVYICGCLD